jgi:hypothetical protein
LILLSSLGLTATKRCVQLHLNQKTVVVNVVIEIIAVMADR